MKSHLLVLQHQGQKGKFTIKSVKKRFKTLLPDNIKNGVAFQDRQLSFCFNIKDKTEFTLKHDLVYDAQCPEERCNDDIVGKTARHTRVVDRSDQRGKKFHKLTLI